MKGVFQKSLTMLFVVAAMTVSSLANSNSSKENTSSILPDVALQVKDFHDTTPYGAIVRAARWDNPTIFVCWENPSPDNAKAMEWTKDAVHRTWEINSPLRFTGWEKCAQENAGIRILIDDSGPHTKALGHFLNNMRNGMVLNFTFKNWSPGCQQSLEQCIRAIAVHEFGHAIGFTHEQNRPDVPGECKPLRQGTDPDTLLTPYDPDSVMNYCNKKWNNDGFLSPLDTDALHVLYGRPHISQ